MRFLSRFQQKQEEEPSLEQPAPKRISLPASQRLTTITEADGVPKSEGPPTPPIPRRSSRRNSIGAAHSFGASKRWSGSTETTLRTAPPPYDWVADPREGNTTTVQGPGDEEKLARLRRGEDVGDKKRRGGWKRLALIIGLVLLVVIALAVGLGVGLSKKKKSESDQGSSAPEAPEDKPPQRFPVGEYSMITALKTIEYGCTTNPATWSCWPYTVFSPSTNASSLASFNWIISNIEDVYATGSSSSTPEEGVPANLTVSSTNDPFGITFTDKPLTYIAPLTNTSSARLTFSFSMSKVVVPSQAITTDNSNAKCFFNETTFTGTLYLSSPRNYPSAQRHSTSLGGYEQWPYAVEIKQAANGGTNVPDCYETTDGQLGQQITYGLVPTASTAECLCEYRNF